MSSLWCHWCRNRWLRTHSLSRHSVFTVDCRNLYEFINMFKEVRRKQGSFAEIAQIRASCQLSLSLNLSLFTTQIYCFWTFISDALRDLLPFVQFKKREKHPCRVTWRLKPATLLQATLLRGSFSRFGNCTNATKSGRVSQFIWLRQFFWKHTLG